MVESQPVHDETSDLLSQSTFDGERNNTSISTDNSIWKFCYYKQEGRVNVFGEWSTKSKVYRYIVIGPDWLWIIVSYVALILISYFIYRYFIYTEAEVWIYFIIFGISLFALTTCCLIDPGLVRKYHHARSRHWTYCDVCDSLRPPNTVHCSTCQTCIASYHHHCQWTGKCIGHGNLLYFYLLVISLAALGFLDILLIIFYYAKAF